MEFPLLTKAPDSYRKLVPKGRLQTVLISAEYLLDGKAYRLVGTVKKTLFGTIRDYNFLDFVVIDEKGNVVRDKELSKRIYYSFSTLSMMYVSERHILASIVDNPAFLQPAIDKYEALKEKFKPALIIFKPPHEPYWEKVISFYEMLVEANETNIEAGDLAPRLNPILERAKAREPMEVQKIEEYKILMQQFVQVTHQRTLLVLRNDEMIRVIKAVIETARARKEIQLEDLIEEVNLIYDFLKGSRQAITKTLIDSGLEFGAKTVEDVINHLVPIKQRGKMIDELSEKQFNNQWFYRKEVS